MRYYIVDDEIGVVKTLENIIQKRLGGTVDGYETNPAEARREILQIKPDVLLVDFLMTEMDGVTLVKQLRGQLPRPASSCFPRSAIKVWWNRHIKQGLNFLSANRSIW